jgi:hypothetical protein
VRRWLDGEGSRGIRVTVATDNKVVGVVCASQVCQVVAVWEGIIRYCVDVQSRIRDEFAVIDIRVVSLH